MQYSPKLKKAMAEIRKILFKEGIAGAVVLHTPGFSEFHVGIQPPYSCCTLDGDKVHFKWKAADYNGNSAVRDERISNTSNMLHLMAETMGMITLNLMEVSEQFDEKVQAVHTKGSIINQKDLEN